MARKKESPKRESGFRLEQARWEEIIGFLLLLLAVVTVLSIISINRGLFTDQWVTLLRLLVGWGVVFGPLWLGGIGLWLVLDSLDRRPDIGLERPFGAGLLYLALLAFLHLFSFHPDPLQLAVEGNGGGLVGLGLSELLRANLGFIGAVIALLALVGVGAIMLFNVSLYQIGHALLHLRQTVRELRFGRAPEIKINVPTPSPGPAVPLHKPAPQKPHEPARVVVGRAPSPRPPQTRVIGQPQPTGVPRTWTLPIIGEIFEENIEQELGQAEIRQQVRIIEETLSSFGVPCRVVEVNRGPTVTQFGLEPGFVERRGPDGQPTPVKVKVSRIAALANDLSLALAASPIRIETPVPGRPLVGIEIPNSQTALVGLRAVIESEAFQKLDSKLKIALGQDVAGQPIVADLGAMPHLLIAGATGSGKSVCINAIIACLLCHNTPDELKLLMVDPKMVELVTYNGIPHLLNPVIVELERVVHALKWTMQQMDERFRMFAQAGARNLDVYNQMMAKQGQPQIPYIVLIIDELADLMMMAPDEVERTICRLAQMSRATGIHLIIATQRPSVDVVTGLIKANFPARLGFAVTTQVDSRVILDTGGAEKLLGRGDMLYMASDSSKLVRLQGCFVSDKELERLVHFWRAQQETAPAAAPDGSVPQTQPQIVQQPLWEDMVAKHKAADTTDDLLGEAIAVVRQYDRASASLLQRRLRVGYSRAARLIDLMEERGIVGPPEGAGRWRKVLQRADLDEDEDVDQRAWEEVAQDEGQH